MARERRFRGDCAAGRTCVVLLCVVLCAIAAATVRYATPDGTHALGAPRGDGVEAKPPVSDSNEIFSR